MLRRIRTEVRPRLADDTLIVRGGTMNPPDLLTSIAVAKREVGKPGLSVHGADGVGVAELISLLNQGPVRRLPHGMVRLSTAGAIRRGGFEIVPTGEPPHQTIELPADYESSDALADLIRLFDAPVRRVDLEGMDYSARE